MSISDEELKRVAQESMKAQPVASTTPDFEAAAMLGGMINANVADLNGNMAIPIKETPTSVGKDETFHQPSVATGIKPVTQQDVLKTGSDVISEQERRQAISNEGVDQNAIIQQQQIPTHPSIPPVQQQPVYPQQIQQPVVQQPAQPYQSGLVFPPNLQSIILGKMLAIEKTHAKIIESQKEILKLLKEK